MTTQELVGRIHEGSTARLFGLLWPLTIAESHARTAAVLVDEFDAKPSIPEFFG